MSILEISLNNAEQSFFNKIKCTIDSYLENIDADNATIEKLATFFLQDLRINIPIFINELSEAKNKFDAIHVKRLPKFNNTKKN